MATEEEKQSMEVQIEQALNSRTQHFLDNAESLTLESVRRLLEKDLGLEEYALDVHKRYVKQLLGKLMEGPGDDASKSPLKHKGENVSSTKTEAAQSPEKNEIKKKHEEPASENGMKTDDSPVMGLMTTKGDSVDAQSTNITESKIKKAIWDRASHIKDNSATISPNGVRRLLEEDLGLPTYSLDAFKKFIRTQLDEVFESFEVHESATGSKKEKSSGSLDTPEKNISETSSGSLDNENVEVVEKAKSRKKAATSKQNIDKSSGMKKRKGTQEVNVSSKKQKKLAKKPSSVNSDEREDDSGSDDIQSETSSRKTSKVKPDLVKQKKLAKKPSSVASDELEDDSGSDDIQSETSSRKTSKVKPILKKQLPTPTYGKRVEKLRAIIKSCGMSVSPALYKKAKLVPEGKREGFLVKELEEILSREGLSTNPTEKEIKEVKKRKDTAKELEGIDMSNIVSSSRRRTTSTFMAPPRPIVREAPAKKTISTKKNKNDDDGDVDKDAPEIKEETEDKVEAKEKKDEKEEEKEDEKEEEEEEEEEEDEEEDDDEDDNDDDDDSEEEFNEDDEDSD